MKKRVSLRTVVYAACAIFALTTAALAQNSGPTVEVRHDSKDSKAVPITQEKESPVQFLLEAGFTSEYIFRGTNLMPNSTGGFFYQAQATIPKVGPGSLTFGLWAIHQIDDASSDSWSVSEGGGGAGTFTGVLNNGDPFGRLPTTTQSSFREIDIFASYKISLGPVDVTFGNILFLIHREASTFEVLDAGPGFIWVNPPSFDQFATLGPEKTVEDETFDRLYVRLSTTKLCPHITPSITYYQTVYNEGTEPTSAFITPQDEFGGRVIIEGPGSFPPGGERNDKLGGYLEARLNGNFPVGHWLDINPYGLVSYSFDDRTVPDAGSPFAGRPYTGFNNAQAGVELDFHITPNIAFVPFVNYSYHISDPPIGTDKNEFWAGVKVAVNLP